MAAIPLVVEFDATTLATIHPKYIHDYIQD